MAIADQSKGVFAYGTTCAYCLWRFTSEAGEAITVCESCGTPYHLECFAENGGCATFGCPAWVTSQAAAGVPGVVAPPPAPVPAPIAPGAAAPVAAPPPTPVPAASAAPTATPGPRWNFCAQCGASLEAEYDFCIHCGQRIGGVG